MSYSLFEFNEFMRRVVALNLPQPIWIRSELADVKVSKGHFYLDLVQKAEDSEETIAQGQAVIWAKNFKSLQKRLGKEIEALLQPGIEIMFLAKAEFHERYGLKLHVEDLDPAYTLGKMEMQRRETLQKLQALNLLHHNSQIQLPIVLQRLAVLSSETAAGLQDFLRHLQENNYGYCFKLTFFQIAVQGVFVEKEAMEQLEKVKQHQSDFDAVFIIRGGGAKLDLAEFDSFSLSKMVAEMPLPVLTGIGHDVDETVLDIVAHTSLKTPTAVADFVIHHNLAYETQLLSLSNEVKNLALKTLKDKQLHLQYASQTFDYQLKTKFRQERQMLDFIQKELPMLLKNRISQASSLLTNLEKVLLLLGPETALKRGFAMIFHDGKQVSDISKLSEKDEISVQMKNGRLQAMVQKIQK